MKTSLLKEILLEQKLNRAARDRGVPRSALSHVEKFAKLPHAVVVSGVRRCGKSTLLNQVLHRLYEDQSHYINFEDERLADFKVEDFNTLYEVFLEMDNRTLPFFFDEIQNIPRWELFVRRMQEKGHKFFITGSNASLLSRELGTKLTGRNMTVELFPFSFVEYLLFRKLAIPSRHTLVTEERAALQRHFSEYLRYGGMPEFLKFQDTAMLKRVYDDILYRDIVARHGIKHVKPLRELGLFFFSHLGGLFSYNNLKNVLHVGSMNTIKKFTDYLEDSYLVFLVNRFSFSLKQQLLGNKKIYGVDNGIANAVAFQFSKNRGKYLENLIFLELRRTTKEIYYYVTRNNYEVDFLVKHDQGDPDLIQVTLHLDDPQVREREIRALSAALQELNLRKGLILTEFHEEEIQIGRCIITVMPTYKWMLERNALTH